MGDDQAVRTVSTARGPFRVMMSPSPLIRAQISTASSSSCGPCHKGPEAKWVDHRLNLLACGRPVSWFRTSSRGSNCRQQVDALAAGPAESLPV